LVQLQPVFQPPDVGLVQVEPPGAFGVVIAEIEPLGRYSDVLEQAYAGEASVGIGQPEGQCVRLPSRPAAMVHTAP
jgi:hypothetical protein